MNDLETDYQAVRKAYNEHMRIECVSRGYDFKAGALAYNEFHKLSLAFINAHGIAWFDEARRRGDA